MEDISKSRENLLAEVETLREQIKLYRTLVENSRDILYRMSLPDGIYEYVSPASKTLFGYSPEEFYASPMLIRKIIHTDWHGYFKEKWQQLLDGEMPPAYEYQIIHKYGDVRWMSQRNVLVRAEDGTPVALEGIVTDITEQKRIEEALRESESRLLEAQKLAKMGNWYWDVKTGNVDWSDEIFEIFRLNPAEFTPQIDSIMALSPWPEDHYRNTEIMEKAIENREIGSFEQRFLRPDGSTGYYQSSYQGVYDNEDTLIAMRGTVQDITERKLTEQKHAILEEQYRQIQKTESIGRLAGGVAHDLNNLLSPIIGFGELLQSDIPSDDPRREAVEEILRAGFLARDLVRQLLAFSRKQTLKYKPVNMNNAVLGFENILRRTIREDIKIDYILSPDIQEVMADIGQIEQVVMNLAVNAADAMPEGGALTIETLQVVLDEEYAKTHQDTAPGDYVMLSVSDTGAGMNDEIRRNLFEPFYSTKGELGTGLGMATVYGIVKQHEGSIWVYSEPGLGTTIKVYLPVAEQNPDDGQQNTQVKSQINGSETVLLVEDNVQVRHLAFSILKKYEYNVLQAPDGNEALSIAKEYEGSIQLLLTDVVMPGINGRELFSRVRELYPQIKVLYMSGYTDNVIAHRGVLDEGIVFIQKPFTVQAMAAKVREALEN